MKYIYIQKMARGHLKMLQEGQLSISLRLQIQNYSDFKSNQKSKGKEKHKNGAGKKF